MELNNNVRLADVRPPRVEDAGLEDCALPPHAIQEAFRRAADALQNVQWHVHSTTNTIFGSKGSGEEDLAVVSGNPGPSNGLREDSSKEDEQSCVDTKTGRLLEEGRDLVVAPGPEPDEGDKVVFGKEAGPRLGDHPCVEGLPVDGGDGKDSLGETEEGPILVLA